jgi:hypothetical protein
MWKIEELCQRLEAELRRFDFDEAIGGTRSRLSLREGGRLLANVHLLVEELQRYSAYPADFRIVRLLMPMISCRTYERPSRLCIAPTSFKRSPSPTQGCTLRSSEK